METTKNYALNKPAQDDFYNVDDFNKNADIIDEKLHALEKPVYEDAKTLETLKSDENVTTAFGKIKLAISELIKHLSDKVVHITADERTKWNAKQDAATAINTGNIGNQSVNYANSANYANGAGNADTVDGHHFNWSGQSGQPNWVWGGNDATNMYVYHPSNFSVNYAKTAGSATDQTARNSAAAASDSAAAASANASGRLSTSGGTMSGALNMGNNGIYATHTVQSNDVLHLKTTSRATVENHAGNSNMDLLCSYLHCVSVVNDSYRGAKENITQVEDETAQKLLDVPVRRFDYRPGFGGNQKNVLGMIVDEVQDIIPEAVVIPEDWNEDEFNELLGDTGNESIPGIDYTAFIPYLIALAQLQQKEINELKQRITALEK